MVGFFQDVVGKKRLLVQFVDRQKKNMGSSLLVFLSLKEEVEMDESLSNSPEKEQGKFLIIDENNEVVEPCMFLIGLYLSLFYCLCYIKDMSTDLSEEQVLEERDHDLNE